MAAMIGGSMVETLTHAPEETEALAAELARRLAVGDVVTVAGELGEGKTTLVRGACVELGVRERVTSPTYTIGHRYHGDGVAISHLDLYRFESVSPAEWGDLEPYFEQARSEEHTSELQSPDHLVCRLLLEKKKKITMHLAIRERKKEKTTKR